MAIFLVVLTVYQFLLRMGHLDASPLYFVLNPYVLLAPFTLVWLASLILHRSAIDKNVFLGCLIVLAVPIVTLPNFLVSENFPFLFIRGLQFFWGPVLLVPALLGLFRITGFYDPSLHTAQRFIKLLSVIAATETILEAIAVFGLHISPLSFPWVNPESQNIYQNTFRPYGILSYPEPNALILAVLFWLSAAYRVRGWIHKLLLLVALGTDLGGTGVFAFLALFPLGIRLPSIGIATSAVITFSAIGVATLGGVTQGALYRLNLATMMRYWSFFTVVFNNVISGVSANELAFGSSTQTIDTVTGMTHDWAYVDVSVAFGLVGLVGYILMYGCLLYLMIPREAGRTKKTYFMVAMLVLNFHYGSLNYYVGQMLVAGLVALQLQRSFASKPITVSGRSAAYPA